MPETVVETPLENVSGRWWVAIPDTTADIAVGDHIDVINSSTDAPLTYYVQDTDSSSSLLQLGDTRLMLPDNTNPDGSEYWDNPIAPNFVCENGYIIPFNLRNEPNSEKITEKAVVFADEYPKAKLLVKQVDREIKKEYETADNTDTKYQRQWYQYRLQLMNPDGSDFAFSEDYITDEKLKIRFLIPEDIAEYKDSEGKVARIPYTVIAQHCLLAGMQFEVAYEESESNSSITRTYTIVRNEDFGAKLPSDILFPQVGDPVVLINWNTKAISTTGIVEDAEQRLMKKGFEYAAALAEDNFALNIEMMSTWMFQLAGEYDTLIDSQDKILVEAQNKVLKARRGLDKYFIPEIGHRVCVKHGSLKNGEKHTRILGYELKLDKPYDTPKLTVGESEAYSRLKQLEKEITKLS
jgi:hypothetical protein